MNQITRNIMMIEPVSFNFNTETALNNYYQMMLNSYSAADAETNEPIVQPAVSEDMPEADEFENSDEIKKIFKEYVSALSGQNKEKEMVQEEISEEDLDSLPISNTKH